MLTEFWQGLGAKLSERWVSMVFAPAFGFWFGGFLAFISRFGWTPFEQWFLQASEPLQIALLVAALLLITASAAAIRPFILPVLRLLEGYWPRWLRHRVLHWQNRRVERDEQHWQRLAIKAEAGGGLAALTLAEREDYAKLDQRLRMLPAHPARRLPTRLGNILRAAEDRPRERYGLETVTCWPRLWLLLPDTARSELSAARASLDTAASLWIWGVLFIAWTIWAWWALPVALAVTLCAYRSALNTAAVYSDLLEAAFDLHRTKLYTALRFPLPDTTDEVAHGERLTEYLQRGPPPVGVNLRPLNDS